MIVTIEIEDIIQGCWRALEMKGGGPRGCLSAAMSLMLEDSPDLLKLLAEPVKLLEEPALGRISGFPSSPQDSLTKLAEDLPEIVPFLARAAVMRKEPFLQDLPDVPPDSAAERERILGLCRLVIKLYPEVFENIVPLWLRDAMAEEFGLGILRCNGEALNFFPEQRRTFPNCLVAVRSSWKAIAFVPPTMNTKEYMAICRMALKRNGNAVRHMPQEKREQLTRRDWLAAMQTARSDGGMTDGSILRLAPQDMLEDDKFLFGAVRRDGLALQIVPEDRKTPELCRAAVMRDGRALRFCPDDVKLKLFGDDSHFFHRAIRSGASFEDVPEAFRDGALYRCAVKLNPKSLRHVPEKFRDREICLSAVHGRGMMLEHVPNDLRDEDMCRMAVKQDGLALEFVPSGKRTMAICLQAVESDGRALRHVPKEHLAAEVIRSAFGSRRKPDEEAFLGIGRTLGLKKKNPGPAELLSRRMLKPVLPEIIRRFPAWLQHVGDKDATPELCEIAVKADGRSLEFVPEDRRTGNLSKKAIKSAGLFHVLEFLPEHVRADALELVRRYVRRKGV